MPTTLFSASWQRGSHFVGATGGAIGAGGAIGGAIGAGGATGGAFREMGEAW